MAAKCPKCDKVVQRFTVVGLDGSVLLGKTWHCIGLCCPHCSAILGAQIDPIAIKTDIVNEIKQR